MTHELKTPLTVIQGYTSLLENAPEDVGMQQKALSHIRNESERLYRMVLQLLDLARRQQPGEKKNVELASFVGTICEAMAVRAERYGMAFCVKLPPALLVWAEEERLRQVFVNLFDNALKYGTQGGRILVSGDWQRGEGDAPGAALVRVENPGFLAAEVCERIFDPFYRVSKEESREKGSAGLGLSLCRQIMEEEGGSIEASCQDGNVCFTMRFARASLGEEVAHE